MFSLPGRSGNFGTGVMEYPNPSVRIVSFGVQGRFSGAQIENDSHRQSLQWQSGRGPDANRSVRNEQLHGGWPGQHYGAGGWHRFDTNTCWILRRYTLLINFCKPLFPSLTYSFALSTTSLTCSYPALS